MNEKVGRQNQVPLQGAALWGWPKVVAFLIEKGADVNSADSRGFTALDYAQGRGGNTGNAVDVGPGRKEVADMLISNGGKVGTPVPQPAGVKPGPSGR